MELRHLRYFIAVAEELSFSKAAKRLNISQPPLSRQIQDLEEELSVALFTRTNRNVQLTSAGRAFLPKARTVLFESRNAADEARRWASGYHETVRIGFMSAIMLTDFPRILRPFHKKYPDVGITFSQMQSDEQLAALLDMRIDAGFVDFGLPEVGDRLRENRIITTPYLHEELCVIVTRDHPLAGRSEVTLAELKDETFAILERNVFPGHHDMVISACHRAGFTPRIRYHADQIPSVLTFAASGMAICISPRLSEDSWGHLVSFISIDSRPHIDIHMITREDDDMMSLDHLRNIVANT